jgi:hypothetical protein
LKIGIKEPQKNNWEREMRKHFWVALPNASFLVKFESGEKKEKSTKIKPCYFETWFRRR